MSDGGKLLEGAYTRMWRNWQRGEGVRLSADELSAVMILDWAVHEAARQIVEGDDDHQPAERGGGFGMKLPLDIDYVNDADGKPISPADVNAHIAALEARVQHERTRGDLGQIAENERAEAVSRAEQAERERDEAVGFHQEYTEAVDDLVDIVVAQCSGYADMESPGGKALHRAKRVIAARALLAKRDGKEQA